ncbi:hypothetical protein CD30_07020 [Ureibacillus massiliensis 4400831 = CIP 108448 = CCUG 49529]|uniref:DUF3243 domain-containing protein n=1 Tax=Ureibacillus massiliensis 4400831 = CIP 108448 = CCUG 49529 TaxID=1211035 RepID=A0A0A3J647_9BACL|nr:DUF3243 domain-containing protein [Ureibacillus massiliensis]KGR91190.1 hypothetical protein CD30_07020 [Ureibacillus massiliensis 4400831 = CIP 108448 = CCUG 49529]BDH61211.1 hypothetical protein MTP04_13410 [Lysinibacillus sp. PLM2]
MALLENWEKWTSFLGQQVENAQETGMSKKMIENTAVQIGNYLAKNVDPKNEQERVLSDLWGVASDDEKHALANCVVKLVQQHRVQ